MKFFKYDNDNGCITFNDEGILIVREYNALMNVTRNKTKTDKLGMNKERA
ncbi:MAG: hypothetical protein ACOH2V_00245 [Candidatus Saccharimonadaceae bacterium]